MVKVINGSNGKYVLVTINIIVVCATSLIIYGMRHGYTPSITVGDAQLSLTKA